ncbi:HNH endonuclease signature motif containing protein [Burkholderia anthina]|uniref:HNH endonuclease signature motif containing protein n=1 Tax=Burkholderia anthina TaxID=179879 RepID=UPI00158D185B|nr:HNH endonuclease signature motif containing protein [Burkholderia anthina]
MTKRKPGSTTPPKVFWTPEQIEILRRRYPNERAEVLADLFDCSVNRVYAKAAKLGLSKSAEFFASAESGRTGHDDRGIAGRFVKGMESWNKGVKGSSGNHPNCRHTQFKAGRSADEARNYVPIGTEKVNRDGYLIRKITDDPTLAPVRRWEAVHRLVWIAANGPIPDGHVVCFLRDRYTTEAAKITIDALELVHRRELARRNHWTNNDPEVARLYQLKGAITRQVNRIAREAKEPQS